MNTFDVQPVAEPLTNDGREPSVLPWAQARQRIDDARYYWLGTAHPSGRPHVRPVLAVWVDDTLYTTSGPQARKGRNLDRDARCSVAVTADDMHIVLKGLSSKVADPGLLGRLAAAYRSKYDWNVTVVGGKFDAPYGAPTAGPPPYQPYAIHPTAVFSFVNDSTIGASSSSQRMRPW